MKLLGSLTLGLLCCVGVVGTAHAQEDYTQQEIDTAVEFAMHDAKYTMYHEIGHMLVGQLGLPVLGKEEDAADALATILLLTDDNDEDSYNALVDAADGWYFNAVNSTGSTLEDLSYYDDHSLSIQRAYAMACFMVGKDPEAFVDTAESYDFDADQQTACAGTYEQAFDAWESVLEPHKVVDEQGAEIAIVYDDGGEEFGDFATILKGNRVLETAAELVMSRYVLPEPVTFRAGLCDEANAYYSPSNNEVIYCYELASQMTMLYLTDILPAVKEREAEEE